MEGRIMEDSKFMPLNIQLFAESGEENANDNVTSTNNVDDSKKGTEEDNKKSVKTYTDEEVNGISTKNVNKALAKQLKDLGIEDVEKAKAILAKAREDEEKNKTSDDKSKELTDKLNKATVEIVNGKIENALLRKGISENKVERAVRLINKSNILEEDGTIDSSKLATEIEEVLKDFPELLSTKKEEKIGFKIGGDGKEDEKDNDLDKMKSIMGLK
jgi:hypothetical protein